MKAPEVIQNSTSYSKESDGWAFGCILYELTFTDPAFSVPINVLKVDTDLNDRAEQEIEELREKQLEALIKESDPVWPDLKLCPAYSAITDLLK